MSSALISVQASMPAAAGAALDCDDSEAGGLSADLPHPARATAVVSTTTATVALLAGMPNHGNADEPVDGSSRFPYEPIDAGMTVTRPDVDLTDGDFYAVDSRSVYKWMRENEPV